jgi:hypothetical protein
VLFRASNGLKFNLLCGEHVVGPIILRILSQNTSDSEVCGSWYLFIAVWVRRCKSPHKFSGGRHAKTRTADYNVPLDCTAPNASRRSHSTAKEGHVTHSPTIDTSYSLLSNSLHTTPYVWPIFHMSKQGTALQSPVAEYWFLIGPFCPAAPNSSALVAEILHRTDNKYNNSSVCDLLLHKLTPLLLTNTTTSTVQQVMSPRCLHLRAM